MNEPAYVFDTYALLEIIEGNPAYLEYMNSRIIITEFILAELCFTLMRKAGVEIGFAYADRLSGFVIPTDKDVIKKAMLFRYENMKRNFSMGDCVGYFLARELGIKFLTGDRQFKGMGNVEFVR